MLYFQYINIIRIFLIGGRGKMSVRSTGTELQTDVHTLLTSYLKGRLSKNFFSKPDIFKSKRVLLIINL